jgi:hypothetical protein
VFSFPRFMTATPVDAILADFEEGDELCCEGCESVIEDEAYYDGYESHYCEQCSSDLEQRAYDEAKAFAMEHCELLPPLPEYDPEFSFRASPEEYENGERESCSPAAYRAVCRHAYSNYDVLIRDLDRDGYIDRIYYEVIRARVEELIQQAIDEMDDDVRLALDARDLPGNDFDV